MSTDRLNARRVFTLGILALGLLMAGNACTNDPNKETDSSGCSYNSTSHSC